MTPLCAQLRKRQPVWIWMSGDEGGPADGLIGLGRSAADGEAVRRRKRKGHCFNNVQ